MAWAKRTMIVTADLAPLARALASGLEPVAGAGMWINGLCPKDGPATAPATRYISTGAIDALFAPLLTDADALFAACGQFGVTLDQCQQLVATSVVVDVDIESPLDTTERLNLQITQLPEE